MYTSAACLIGLRPVISRLSHWIQKLAIRNKPRGPPRDRAQSSPIAVTTGENSSLSIFNPDGERIELTSFEHDAEEGRKESLDSPYPDRLGASDGL